MLVNRTQIYSGHKRQLKDKLSEKSLPLSSYPMTQSNNRYFERPLKNNSENLSFKGLSFMGDEKSESKKKKQINPTLVMLGTIAAAGLGLRLAPAYKEVGKFKISELNDFFDKYGKSVKPIANELVENLKGSKFAKEMIKIDKNNSDIITLNKKTVPQLIWDGLKYPFTVLPADILNGSVELLGKFKPLKGWAEKTLEKPLFKNIRQRSKIDAKVNSLQGLFETRKDLLEKLAKGELNESQIKSEVLGRTVKMFDTEKYGAYDTKHERSLNRLVSGLPPAIFLANDAYNLSRMMDDDPKKAEKEKKTRFSQEVTRILTSGYLTLVTLGALNKYINNSKLGIMLMTGGTVLLTEAFSRLSNGKHIKRLTAEEARAENEKNNAPEKNIKPDTSFKANPNNKSQDKASQQKPLLSFDTIMKASAVVIAAGFGIKGLRKIPAVDSMFKTVQEPFQNLYKKLTVIPDHTITQKKFDSIVEVLEKHGYNDLAVEYKEIAKSAVDSNGIIHLGKKDKRYAKPAVNFVIAPFKFAYNTVTLPYRLVNKAMGMFKPKMLEIKDKQVIGVALDAMKKDFKLSEKQFTELKGFVDNVLNKKILKSETANLSEMQQNFLSYVSKFSAFAKSVENIGKKAVEKGMTPKQFKSYINDNINKAFNVTTMSNVSNAELSNLAKTAATAATLWFLMTDNYNMVMLKSNGNDKEGAETKFKERFVQEGSRLFYQTLLIDLFNSTFRSQYNGSLLGMSWITLTNTTMGEWLTRKSVGMPVGAHSRAELESIEKQQNEATGFLKGYYNFMRRLTGKRSIESYHVADKKDENQIAKTEKPVNFTNSRPVFDKMIKG